MLWRSATARPTELHNTEEGSTELMVELMGTCPPLPIWKSSWRSPQTRWRRRRMRDQPHRECQEEAELESPPRGECKASSFAFFFQKKRRRYNSQKRTSIEKGGDP